MDDLHKHSPLLTADAIAHSNVYAFNGTDFDVCSLAAYFSQAQYYNNNQLLTNQSLFQITVLKTLDTTSDLGSMIGQGGEGRQFQIPTAE
jgi:hypothetical protein